MEALEEFHRRRAGAEADFEEGGHSGQLRRLEDPAELEEETLAENLVVHREVQLEVVDR